MFEKIICRVLKHVFHTPFRNHIPTHYCIRCGADKEPEEDR